MHRALRRPRSPDPGRRGDDVPGDGETLAGRGPTGPGPAPGAGVPLGAGDRAAHVGGAPGQTVTSAWSRSVASMYSSTIEKTTSLALRTVVARPMTWPQGLKFTSWACSG